MFFEGDRIDAMREMILADNVEDRKKALAKLLPYQRDDFVGIFKALKGFPATIRFLDPPLHEFLPHDAKSQSAISRKKIGVSVEKIAQRVDATARVQSRCSGIAVAVSASPIPEITEMQARAVFEAAAEVRKRGIKVKPEIMIPLVGFKKEFDLQVEIVHRVAQEVMTEKKVKFDYLVGTMIEVPRGALTADEIAKTRGVLQLRHQRSDADRARHEPRRHAATSFRPTSRTKSSRRTRSPRSIRPASAS